MPLASRSSLYLPAMNDQPSSLPHCDKRSPSSFIIPNGVDSFYDSFPSHQPLCSTSTAIYPSSSSSTDPSIYQSAPPSSNSSPTSFASSTSTSTSSSSASSSLLFSSPSLQSTTSSSASSSSVLFTSPLTARSRRSLPFSLPPAPLLSKQSSTTTEASTHSEGVQSLSHCFSALSPTSTSSSCSHTSPTQPQRMMDSHHLHSHPASAYLDYQPHPHSAMQPSSVPMDACCPSFTPLPPSPPRSPPAYLSLPALLSPVDVDLLSSMFRSEQRHQPSPFYLHAHPHLDSGMRPVLFDWLMEVAAEFHLQRETFQLAINYTERFLSIAAAAASTPPPRPPLHLHLSLLPLAVILVHPRVRLSRDPQSQLPVAGHHLPVHRV